MVYATTTELVNILGIRVEVPSWDIGNSQTNEEVGTGDDSTTIFYLDRKHILASSYTLYYGATAAATDTLTETTHYTLDKSTGIITLTGAGVTLLSTNKIFAKYNYISLNMTDEYLAKVLSRAEQRVNELCNTAFYDGTSANPGYGIISGEYQPSKGHHDNVYFTEKRPIKDVNSLLSGDIALDAETIGVTTGEGTNFPTTGTIIIGTEIITYTGVSTDNLTGCTRGVGDSTAATHSEDDEVHTTIIQISGSQEGVSPTWYPQEWNTDVYVNEQGEIFLYRTSLLDSVTADNLLLPQFDVAKRVKLTYLYGFDTIPESITRLTLLLAKRMLMTDTVSKSLISGRNEFRPEMININREEINEIVGSYRQIPMGNT